MASKAPEASTGMARFVQRGKREAPDRIDDLDDIVGPGVHRIAEATPDNTRRVRHLIDKHGFPCFKRGGKFYSRHSWIAAYYDQDEDQT